MLQRVVVGLPVSSFVRPAIGFHFIYRNNTTESIEEAKHVKKELILSEELEKDKLYIIRNLNRLVYRRKSIYREDRMNANATSQIKSWLMGVDKPNQRSSTLFSSKVLYQTLDEYVERNRPMFESIAFYEQKNDIGNWFTIMALHIWIINVRLRYEGQAGGLLQHELFQHFWNRFTTRLDDEIGNPVHVMRYKHAAKERYYGFWISLDHGMLCGDAYLANAIFRNYYGIGSELPSARSVEIMVQYIHRMLKCMDFHPSETILDGVICFPKLSEEMQVVRDRLDEEKEKKKE